MRKGIGYNISWEETIYKSLFLTLSTLAIIHMLPYSVCIQPIQRKLPHKTINNFTSDWNDGTLVAALVDAMAPGLCPENEEMDPQNALHNAAHAMKLAEDWLDVPQVSD